MKKFIAVILAAVTLLSVFMFAACAEKPADEEITLNFILPSGSPAISAAKLITEHNKIEGVNITYQVVQGPEHLQPSLINGDAQLAIVPANIAANIYNQSADQANNIKLLSVNVHGALYIVGQNDLASLNDLKGKVLYSIGQTGTPGMTLRYILEQSGIAYEVSDTVIDANTVSIKYVSAASEVLPLLKAGDGEVEYAVLAEPAVTQATAIVATGVQLKVVKDLQAEWKRLTEATYDGIPQAVFVANDAVIQKYPKVISEILNIMEENVEWLKAGDNTSKAISAINQKLNIASGTVINADIIQRSAINVIRAEAAKDSLIHYYGILAAMNNKVIGGKLPDNNFYYNVAK